MSLFPAFQQYQRCDVSLKLDFHYGADLGPKSLDWAFQLCKDNMQVCFYLGRLRCLLHVLHDVYCQYDSWKICCDSENWHCFAAVCVSPCSAKASIVQELYKATWGWSDKKKRKELKHDSARFIIAEESTSGDRPEGCPAAYIHFRQICHHLPGHSL